MRKRPARVYAYGQYMGQVLTYTLLNTLMPP